MPAQPEVFLTKPCEHCRKPFRPTRAWHRFCCQRCQTAGWVAVRRGNTIVLKPGERITIEAA